MKKLVFYLILICGFAVSFPGFSQTPKPTPTTEHKPIVLVPKTSTTIKRAPSRMCIECVYGSGVLTFLPADFYEMLTVTVSEMDGTDEWVEIITDDANTILLDESHSYNITAVTPDGRIFTGTVD